jgi:hypothetical protein
MTARPLSARAREIAGATLEALQQADEIGGCDATDEYVDLMNHLIDNLQRRRATALIQDAPFAPITLLKSPHAGPPQYNW